jgi:putative endonuclease
MWYVYLIECRNGCWYAGITNDVEARYAAHAAGKGARYTRANPPVKLLGARPFEDRSAASRAEYALKRLARSKKLAWLLDGPAPCTMAPCRPDDTPR